MRPRRTYSDYLRDIHQAAVKALAFIEDMDLPTFSADRKTNLAVVRSLEIIGEATRHIPASIRSRYSEEPWQDMAAMRNKLIHEYFGVDLEVLWRTVREDLPQVRDALERIIDDLDHEARLR